MNRDRVERQLRRWERVRAAGRKRFILLWGVLGWGVSTGLLFSATIIPSERPSFSTAVVTVVVSVILFPLGGFFFGYWLWQVGNWNYRFQKWRLARDATAA